MNRWHVYLGAPDERQSDKHETWQVCGPPPSHEVLTAEQMLEGATFALAAEADWVDLPAQSVFDAMKELTALRRMVP